MKKEKKKPKITTILAKEIGPYCSFEVKKSVFGSIGPTL